jgi:hypothetical protein
MKTLIRAGLLTGSLLACAMAPAYAAEPAASGTTVSANPTYQTIQMDIEIDRSAKVVWERVGKYCDIAEWLKLDCKITAGDGKSVGTVRDLAGGRVKEILVAQTELSYGYTQPVREGRVYDLYHGFMEARVISPRKTKLIYTLLYDNSMLPDQAARDADVARRRTSFEGALKEMKRIAEGK